MSELDQSRRDFLGRAAAGAMLVVAPGVTLLQVVEAREDGEPASSKVRYGMLIDTNACKSDCNECVSACNKEAGLSGGTHATDPQWIRKVELRNRETGRTLSLPMMCQHCAKPPCVDVCPTEASFKRADGVVLVDRHRCIGCRYCMMACPYKARSFVHEEVTNHVPGVPRGKGTVESCNLCVQRIDHDRLPACVEACEKAGNKAMLFGDLNDPSSEISKKIREVASVEIRADLGLHPGIHYQGL